MLFTCTLFFRPQPIKAFAVVRPAAILLLLLLLKPFSGLSADEPEKVHLHTDRDIYIAGEYLYFSARTFNGHEPGESSSAFLYVALRNSQGVIIRATLPIKSGRSQGALYLHDTLPSGYYQLTAHTQHMRNWSQAYMFNKQIFIANRFDNELQEVQPPVSDPAQLRLSFYPESGTMVRGLPASLLIRAEGNFDAADRKLWLLNAHGDTLSLGQLNERGFGSMSFIPDTLAPYSLFVDGGDQAFSLPDASESGITMHLTPAENNGLHLRLMADSSSLRLRGRLRIYSPEGIYQEVQVNQQTLEYQLSYPAKDLPQGLLIFAFDSPLTEKTLIRPWYQGGEKNTALQLRSSPEYARRQKARISLQLDTAHDADLSVSISPAYAHFSDSYNAAAHKRALYLSRFLPLDPAESLPLLRSLNPSQINELLVALVSDVPHEQVPKPLSRSYLKETQGLIVSGELIDILSRTPLSDRRIVLNTPDTLINLQYALTDTSGIFRFLLSDYYHDRELFFRLDPSSMNDSDEGINPLLLIDDKFSLPEGFQAQTLRELWIRRESLARSQEIERIRKSYELEYHSFRPVALKNTEAPPRLYSRASQVFRLDNFIPLDDLPEISREIIGSWRIRRGAENHVLSCASTRTALPGEPGLFINGVWVSNLLDVMDMGSDKLHRIDVHNLRWVHGSMEFSGVIGIFTRDPHFNRFAWNGASASLRHIPPRDAGFYSDRPAGLDDSMASLMPDLRQTLYWNPKLLLKAGRENYIDFNTSDLPGEYIIVIEGNDVMGHPIRHEALFKVN